MSRGTRVNANYIVGALGKFFKKNFRQKKPLMAKQNGFSSVKMLQFILPPLSEIGSPPKASCCWNNCCIHLSSSLQTF